MRKTWILVAMISDSTHLKIAIAVSALLHMALLGYAHTVEAPEELAPFPVLLRKAVTIRVEKIDLEIPARNNAGRAFRFEPLGSPVQVANAPPEIPDIEPDPKPEPATKSEVEPKRQPETEPEHRPESEPKVTPTPQIKPLVASKSDEAPEVTRSTAPDMRHDTEQDTSALKNAPTGREPSPGVGKRVASVGSKSSGSATHRTASNRRSSHAHADQVGLNRQYGRVLYTRINKAKVYPRMARRAGLEGRLLVAITVDRTGKLLDVTIRESSGHATLDSNALATIRGLGQFPLPPSGLSWGQKTFVLPMKYSIQ